MSEETTYVGIRGEWQDLLKPFEDKPPGLEHLQPLCGKFIIILGRTNELTMQQAALSANRQAISKELRQLMSDGQRYAAVLRRALKAHFGPRAEELTAFKLQPFRGRKVKAELAVKAKGVEKPAPDAEGATSAADHSDR
jgi:hypothetical protein